MKVLKSTGRGKQAVSRQKRMIYEFPATACSYLMTAFYFCLVAYCMNMLFPLYVRYVLHYNL